MNRTGKKSSGNSILRAVVVALSFLLQIGWIFGQILLWNRYSAYVSSLTSLVAVIVVLRLYSKQGNTAYKLPWIMLIMAMPIMGLSLYLINQSALSTRSIRKRMKRMEDAAAHCLNRVNGETGLRSYLQKYAGAPVYGGTAARYYGETLDVLEDMKRDLQSAKNFIFMEYFILQEGEAFSQIREILERKAAQGVEVRLMYDDLGSIGTSSWSYAAKLNKSGIQCRTFNPAIPFLKLFLNHRDHRKITVIDGKIGYTGGFNLADEYFHYTSPYGQWKDTGLRLEGPGVQSLTVQFLQLWNVNSRTAEDLSRYLSGTPAQAGSGFVQPFGDDPLKEERVTENVLLNLIGGAKKYIWFMTPYLMITDELSRSLELAAKRGVDVRILVPGIPDKWVVGILNSSYFPALLERGVRIYTYDPGFCHGKVCVCDGETACVGTSNLDYRSLYLHYENNVMLYGCDAVRQAEKDLEALFDSCTEVTVLRTGPVLRLCQSILRLFAPLL